MNIAHHQGYGFFQASGKVALEAEDTELAPTGGEVGGGNLLDRLSGHTDIIAGIVQVASPLSIP